ncbi:HCP-like protein [Auricularia subglabra TFB-10046 SS5]|nr:HCP-like protein [Auricularia subglabra TFB-10046 SS5]
MQGPGQASGSGSGGERGFAYQQGRPPPPPQQTTPTKSAQQHGREASEAPTLRAAREVLNSGRASEETIREPHEKRGWFGRRERRPSHESSGRRSPTGSAHSHRQYIATLPNPSPGTLRADSAQEYLTLGIGAHEALKLAESAYCFEQAATFRGGCAVGMLMWGLALRHAWGVRKDEKEGFKWLRRAAGRAVEGLEMAYSGKDSKEGKGELEGVKTELVLAIYEVGQCFFHGWGVVTDKKMAVSYYQVAARLGDADAQQALAFCYANGRGTKKDLKESAKWYRAAAAQGASTVGLAWIYKTKYGAEEDADGRPAQR